MWSHVGFVGLAHVLEEEEEEDREVFRRHGDLQDQASDCRG